MFYSGHIPNILTSTSEKCPEGNVGAHCPVSSVIFPAAATALALLFPSQVSSDLPPSSSDLFNLQLPLTDSPSILTLIPIHYVAIV